MNHNKKQEVIKRYFDECNKITNSKGVDYAGNEDALSNFKESARISDTTPFKELQTLFNKHFLSFNNAINKNPKFPKTSSGAEPIEEKVKDMINYLFLFLCLLEEEKNKDFVYQEKVITYN